MKVLFVVSTIMYTVYALVISVVLFQQHTRIQRVENQFIRRAPERIFGPKQIYPSEKPFLQSRNKDYFAYFQSNGQIVLKVNPTIVEGRPDPLPVYGDVLESNSRHFIDLRDDGRMTLMNANGTVSKELGGVNPYVPVYLLINDVGVLQIEDNAGRRFTLQANQ